MHLGHSLGSTSGQADFDMAESETASGTHTLARGQATCLVRSWSGNLRLGKSRTQQPDDYSHASTNAGLLFVQHQDTEMPDADDGVSSQLSPEAEDSRYDQAPHSVAEGSQEEQAIEACFQMLHDGEVSSSRELMVGELDSSLHNPHDTPQIQNQPTFPPDWTYETMVTKNSNSFGAVNGRTDASQSELPDGSSGYNTAQNPRPFDLESILEELFETEDPVTADNTTIPFLPWSPESYQHMGKSARQQAQSEAAAGFAENRTTIMSHNMAGGRSDSPTEAHAAFPSSIAAKIQTYQPPALPVREKPVEPIPLPQCETCLLPHPIEDACLTCTECHLKGHLASCPSCPGPPSFTLFTKLPCELRDRIYAYALTSPRAILPHLCDKALKFHDDNAHGNHGSVTAQLGVTQVSKQTRAESLPIFYSANTFAIGPDTACFFDHLAHLGRFELLRNVQFAIRRRPVDSAPITLRSMTQYLAEASAYETALAKKYKINPASPGAVAKLVGSSHNHLTKHPQYTTGALTELSPFICLRKLCSPCPVTRLPMLALPIPSAAIFTDYPALTWFPTVCAGLGVALRHVTGVPVRFEEGVGAQLVWRQKYQKKEFAAEDVRDALEQERVCKRVGEMYPTLETMNRPRLNAYMRFKCDGSFREWVDVHTVGGGFGAYW